MLIIGLVAIAIFETILGILRTYLFAHTTIRIDVERGARLCIVVDAGHATPSHIVSPQVLPFTWRNKLSTLIANVATTANSGSGVFDLTHKCLLGVISQKIPKEAYSGDAGSREKDIAKYLVPASTIRAFIPTDYRF